MPRYLGIDPGLSSALAIVETINGLPVLVDTIDMPITGTRAKTRVDIFAAAKWIGEQAPSADYVERAQAFPGQGASSGFSYVRAVGALEAVIIAEAARQAGYLVHATDLVDRGYFRGCVDFLRLICNPPFNLCNRFVRHAQRTARA